MKAIVSHYRARLGTNRVRRRKGKGKRREETDGAMMEKETVRMVAGCTCDIAHEENPCAIVFDGRFKDVIQTHHVMFRFRAGCKEPRNVDGKLAWSTKDTETRFGPCVVRLMFKSKDNPNTKYEFVPLTSLELCAPALKEDEALVVSGEEAWKVVYPSHNGKDASNNKSGMYCKMSAKAKKKDSKLFDMKSITRIREHAKGPPLI